MRGGTCRDAEGSEILLREVGGGRGGGGGGGGRGGGGGGEWTANLLHLLWPVVHYDVSRARIGKPFKETRNRFTACRAGTTTTNLSFLPARHAT
jgi:hypothetical protein